MTVLQVVYDMAEALAGLSLACNIIQLIEFSCKILIDSREVYNSKVGLASQHVALESIAKGAKDLSDNIAAQPNASSSLITLADQSKRPAQDLLDAIDKLRRKPSHSKWDSFRVALKTVLRESKINQIHQDLASAQAVLSQHLQYYLLYVLKAS